MVSSWVGSASGPVGGSCSPAGASERGVVSRGRNRRGGSGEAVAAPGGRLGVGVCLALALALGCSHGDQALELGQPDFAGGQVRVHIDVGNAFDPATLAVWFDGRRLHSGVTPDGAGFQVTLPSVPGPHLLAARAKLAQGHGVRWGTEPFTTPPALPALSSSDPTSGGSGVSPEAWLRLAFATEPPPGSLAHLGLACNGSALPSQVDALGQGVVVLNPTPDLPADAACALSWLGPSGVESLLFTTASLGAPVVALYDRTRTDTLAPFPDDFYRVDDPSTPTHGRLDIPIPDRPGLIPVLFDALLADTRHLDGFSPLAPLVVETDAALDPATVPRTAAESLDPLAAMQLIDLADGARVPFHAQVRSDTTAAGSSDTLMLFPARPLDPKGTYALVLTRRLEAPGNGSVRPLSASSFFAAARAAPSFGEAPEVTRVRDLLSPVWPVLENEALPRIPREDVALVLRISVRSVDSLSQDLLTMREQIHAAPPPALGGFVVQEDTTPGSHIAAIVRGTWDAPDWRLQNPSVPSLLRANLVRDADGLPVLQGTRPVPFVLTLPEAAENGPVPLVMHQHGNPGDMEEVVSTSRQFLSEAGYAVAGFTDILNREVAPPVDDQGNPRTDEQRIEDQVLATFISLFVNKRMPDYWVETTAEQLAFLRFLSSLGDLDVLPLGAPDGVPDLSVEPLLYHGISEGANNGQALVPYAPELRAAALVAGGARLAEVLVHQQADIFLTEVPAFVPGMLPSEIWVGVSLFQTIFDQQDRQNQLYFAYRNPVVVDGTTRKPSILLVEGLDDSLVPNSATESAAWLLGIPQTLPLREVPFLAQAPAPVRANVDAETTGALVQYAPTGLPDLPPTPGCAALPPSSGSEGHYCAQGAAESRAQRVEFFRSALDGVPEIVDPDTLP